MAHAMGRRYKSDTRDRAICGAFRNYSASTYRPSTRRDVRCIRCLRILGHETPKKLRVQIALANAELRMLRAIARR
jgi:hypothetical protein